MSEAFTERVFTPAECEYCREKAHPASSYAGIFCAKEAFVKALKCGFGHGVMPRDVEILHGQNGAPVIAAHGKAKELASAFDIDVSISHDGDSAVAVVLLTKKDKP